MASTLMTPGVYIEEKNAFPSSAVAVETAVPAFIGYTQKAERFGKSLLHKPTRITSFAEFIELFGGGFQSKFTIAEPTPEYKGETFIVNGKPMMVKINDKHTLYLYNSIRLFYANGGSNCYIVSVGTYGTTPEGIAVSLDDFTGSDTKPDVLALLEKEFEPTLVVIPDVIALGAEAYNTVYTKVLAHCAKTQSRFGIFDLAQQGATDTTKTIVDAFRDKIGINALNYGAAYYPWLKTAIVQQNEVDFENLDATVDLETLLPELQAQQVVKAYKAVATPDSNAKKNYHQSLKASSPVYNSILEEIRSRLNELPPSGAIAGIYTLVDNTRGVWKSPANVSVNMVNAPSVNISGDEQKDLNVDVMAGKSINVIRPFPGIGTLIWGGRTLDGNSQDWRYINVRRTLIMIEQSIKLAARTYVFEPNDATTWITVKSMIDNFLVNLWKQGALAGSAPEQAFDVQIGLGSTMTPQDILDGKMLITVKVAIVRPAEFIVITFQQMMQQS
ncbi:phage tail sheath family protein [Chitinophaga tropicalis]|uniref:Phage tail sheath family protein n=1 Tax=Chitinophaga tropicalis TaxID=2683588 RepID=A0A7K1U9V2_9BACT|nr:phage tail sheath C-terminal domain-containing protein [Chitinophaga tropicalis]MVT11142.1 phage tail sheath family protein [Chitinophaga tropicalis]